MASKLTRFLVELGQNPHLRQSYSQDPEAVMSRRRLSKADKSTLRAANDAGSEAPKIVWADIEAPKIVWAQIEAPKIVWANLEAPKIVWADMATA